MKSKNDRIQTLFRLERDTLEKLKAKTVEDGVSLQKALEIFSKAYIKGDKHLVDLVKKYANEKYSRKRRYSFTEMEAEELLRKIEELSPLDEVNNIFREIESENKI